MFIPKKFRSENVRRAALIISVPIGIGMILNAGLAVADTQGNGTAHPSGAGHTHTQGPTGTHSPTGEVTTKPPTATHGPSSTPPPTTTRPSTTGPGTTPPPTTTRPSTTGPGTTPPPTTTRPSTPPPGTSAPPTVPPTAKPFAVTTSTQISFDANGRGSIAFTVTNNTDQAQPARDVYARSTGALRILSVPGCSAAPALKAPGPAWTTTFKCAPGALGPHETKRWSAAVEYLPAVQQPRAARAEVRLPLAPEADISTFCVLVVPEGATDTSVVLGVAGPLTLSNRANNNDPSFIGYTVDTPVPGGTTGGGSTGGGTTGGTTTSGGSTGGTTTGGTTGGGSTGGTDQATPPTSLPKTGSDDDTLSLAGGALGLMLVGNALFQGARLRRIRSAEGDDEPDRD